MTDLLTGNLLSQSRSDVERSKPQKQDDSRSDKRKRSGSHDHRDSYEDDDDDDADNSDNSSDDEDQSSKDFDDCKPKRKKGKKKKKKHKRKRMDKDQRKDKKKKARREDPESDEDEIEEESEDDDEGESFQHPLGRYFSLHSPSIISNEIRVFYTPCESSFYLNKFPMLENVLYQAPDEASQASFEKSFIYLIRQMGQLLPDSFKEGPHEIEMPADPLAEEIFLKLIFHLQEFKIERRFKKIIEPAETAYFYKFEGQEFSISIDGNLVKVNYEGESPLAVYSLMEFLFQQIKMKSIRFEFMSYLLEEDTYYQISAIQDFMINPNKSQCDSLGSKSFLLIQEAHFPWIPSSLHEEYLFSNYDIYLFSFSSDIDSITTRFSEQLFQRLTIHSTEGCLFRKTRVYLDNARTRRNGRNSLAHSYYALARSKIFVPIFTFAELEHSISVFENEGDLLSSCFLAYFLHQKSRFSSELMKANNENLIAIHLQTIYPIFLDNERRIKSKSPEEIRLFFENSVSSSSSSLFSLRSIEEIFSGGNFCSPKQSDICFLWKVFLERFIALVSADPTKEFHWTPSSEKVVITKELLNLLYLNQTTPSISTLTEAYRSPLLDCYLQDLQANHPSQLFYCYQRIASHCGLPFSSSIEIPAPCLYYSISHYRGSLLHQQKMIDSFHPEQHPQRLLVHQHPFDINLMINELPTNYTGSVLSEYGSIQSINSRITEQKCWKIEDSLRMIKEYVQRAQTSGERGGGAETSNKETTAPADSTSLSSTSHPHAPQNNKVREASSFLFSSLLSYLLRISYRRNMMFSFLMPGEQERIVAMLKILYSLILL